MSNFASPHSEGPVNSPQEQAHSAESQEAPAQFMVDNRPEAAAQRKLQASLNNRPEVRQLRPLDNTPATQLRSAAAPPFGFQEAKGAMQRACAGRGQDDACISGPMDAVSESDGLQLKADPQVRQLMAQEFSPAADEPQDYQFLS